MPPRPSYTLRPATPDDVAYAFGLYRTLMQPLTEAVLPWNEERQRAVVTSGIDAGAVRIVQIEEEAVGWLQLDEGADALALGQLYLEPRWQGRGIGTSLIAAIQRRARTAGRSVKLSVMHGNLRALALYERLGFVETGRDPYKVHLSWSAPPIDVVEEGFDTLPQYVATSIAYRVERVLDVEPVRGGLGGLLLTERAVQAPYVKDYDALEGEGPIHLPRTFDLSRWGLLTARIDGRRVGGAIIAFDTHGVDMLMGRTDLAVLWDLRVAPEHRGHGVGSALFGAVEIWARMRRCRQLVIETQNNNVDACRFYASRGCALGAIDRFAYPELPDEVQLLWIRSLS